MSIFRFVVYFVLILSLFLKSFPCFYFDQKCNLKSSTFAIFMNLYESIKHLKMKQDLICYNRTILAMDTNIICTPTWTSNGGAAAATEAEKDTRTNAKILTSIMMKRSKKIRRSDFNYSFFLIKQELVQFEESTVHS